MPNEETKAVRAPNAHRALCTHLDAIGLKYTRDDDDKFLTLSKGMLSLEQFVESEKTIKSFRTPPLGGVLFYALQQEKKPIPGFLFLCCGKHCFGVVQ